MKEKFLELWAQVRVAFGRLNQREQFAVLGGGAAAVLLVFMLIGLIVANAISKTERRVQVKTDQLAQVLQLQGEYNARKREHDAKLAELRRSNVRLISLVEEAARSAGVEIGQLRPEDGEPSPDGIIESRVDLRAQSLSADRLEKFLELVEKGPGLVVIRRLKIDRPFRKDTVDIELTVTTYKAKS